MTDEQKVVTMLHDLKARREARLLEMEPLLFDLARAIDLALFVHLAEVENEEPISRHGSPMQRILEDCRSLLDGLLRLYGGDDSAA